MPVPSNITTADAALTYLNNNPNISSADVEQLAKQMKIDVPGAKSVLAYSGSLGDKADNIDSGDIAETIGKNSPTSNKVATIGQTEFGKLMTEPSGETSTKIADALKKSIARENGWPENDLRVKDAVGKKLFGETIDGARTTPGMWDDGSGRFIETNAKPDVPVNTLTPTADPSRVFTQTEIDKMLQSGTPTIDGVPRQVVQNIHDKYYNEAIADGKTPAQAKQAALAESQKAIRAKSFEKALDLEYVKDPTTGKVSQVTDTGGKFLSGAEDAMPHGSIPDSTPGKSNLSKSLGNVIDSHWDDLVKGAKNLAEGAGIDIDTPGPGGGARALAKAGLIGDVIGIALMASEAQAAVDANDYDKAARIIGDFAAGTVGAIAVGAAAVAVAAVALPAIGVTGTVGMLLAGAVGLAGSVFGDAAGRAALDKMLEMAGDLGLLPEGGVAGILDDYGWALDNPGALMDGLKDLGLPDWLSPLTGVQGGGSIVFTLSPLVLDLDGDGVEVTKLGFEQTASHVYFDLDNDGFAERTGWITGGDGLLAIDKNNNGKIDNQAELFGNTASFADGFANLKSYDSNNDNKITSADAQWSQLRVWIDADGDGITDAGELKTLSSLKITQINLNAVQTIGQEDLTNYNNENWIGARSTFVIDGQTRAVDDIWFRHDQADTRYLGNFTLNPDTLFLPTIRGYGTLKDLHVAMSQDAVLLNLVKDFVRGWELSDIAKGPDKNAAVKAIIERWAGIDGIADDASLYGMNAKAFLFMEKITGQKPDWWSPELDPAVWVGRIIETTGAAYANIFAELKTLFLGQVGAGALFENAYYDLKTGEFVAGTLAADAAQKILDSEAAAEQAYNYDFWSNMTQFLLGVKPLDQYTDAERALLNHAFTNSYAGTALTWAEYAAMVGDGTAGIYALDGSMLDDKFVGSGGFDIIRGNGGNDVIYGRSGGDRLHGGAGDDQLFGEAGNDWLQEDSGTNHLYGGVGENTLEGGTGDDTFVYGGGRDIIRDWQGNDTIRIEAPYTRASTALYRIDEFKLGIRIQNQLVITVETQFGDNANPIEKILHGDGVVWNLAAIQDIRGTGQTETLKGADNAILRDDALYGYGGNDTLDGGLGNDWLFGGEGNDKYVYASGSNRGTDTIYDQYGSADSISMGSSYTSANTTFKVIGNNLAIVSGGNTLILIRDQFGGNATNIESVRFGDGVTVKLLTYSHLFTGTNDADYMTGISFGAGGDRINGLGGNDSIYAGAGNDIIDGGADDDWIIAEDGDDTITGGQGDDYINAGSGNDTIIYSGGLDRITGGAGSDTLKIDIAGVTAGGMTLKKLGDSLEVQLSTGHKIMIEAQFSQDFGVEKILFQNGSTLSLSTVQYTQTGTGERDYITGVSYGGNPNDVMSGMGEDDNLVGGLGNDTLDGGLGLDMLDGGDGNDTYKIAWNQGVDTVYDTNGSDVISFGAGFNRATMTLVRDVNNLNILFGGVLAAVVQNHFNADGAPLASHYIEKFKFADGTEFNLSSHAWTQAGTNGYDTLRGHDGYDKLYGSGGSDVLQGNGGNDLLNGGGGDDDLYGGLGNDSYYWTPGQGNDRITEQFNEGTDTLRITGTINPADIRWWTDVNGNLTVQSVMNPAHQVNVYGRYDYATGAVLTGQLLERIQFDNGRIWDLAAGLNMNDTDDAHGLYGSAFGETIRGNGGDDIIRASGGDDILFGDAGDDSIYGEDGNDHLTGGTGGDALQGGQGNDTYFWGASDGPDVVYEYIGEGADTLRITGVASGAVRWWSDYYGDLTFQIGNDATRQVKVYGFYDMTGDGLRIGERLETVQYDDGVTLNLTQGLNMVDSDEGHSLYGTTFGETIRTYGGNDYIYAQAGNDKLYGGKGDDALFGGLGNDIYYWSASSDGRDEIREYLNEGTDTLRITGVAASDIRWWSDTYGDLYFQLGADTAKQVFVHGLYNSANGTSESWKLLEKVSFDDSTLWDLTKGFNMVDTDTGHTMTGTAFAETINGKGGDDWIIAGAGNDTVIGGAGADTLYGNEGSDIFKFLIESLDGQIDNLRDFKKAEGDKLDIKDILIGYNPGTSDITKFIQITSSNGDSLVKLDRDGTGTAYGWKQVATIYGETGLADEQALVTNGTLIV